MFTTRKPKGEKFYLYKYFNIDGEVKTDNGSIPRLDIVRDLLLNKRIFIPSLQVLNDPFEEMVNEDKNLKSTDADLKKGVLSFTTHYDNLLMWSHYGNSHTGIVIKFSINEDELINYKKVQYVQGISELNLHDRIFVKSYHWSYENEYRRSFANSSQHTSLESIGLTIEGVILGSKCHSDNYEHIHEICLAENIKFGSVKLNKDFSCSLKNGLQEPFQLRKNSIVRSIEQADYPDYHDIPYDQEAEEQAYKEQKEYWENIERQAEESPEYKELLKHREESIKKLSKFKN